MKGQIRTMTWPEFPEFTGQNFRNPHTYAQSNNAALRRHLEPQLRPAIAVMNQAVEIAVTRMERLLQRVEGQG